MRPARWFSCWRGGGPLLMTRWVWGVLVALLVLLPQSPLCAATAPTPESRASQADRAMAAGSYEVAPVRILGIPAIVVASPQLHGEGTVVAARRRAELIEGNLRLLYEPRSLCTASERLSEELLEGLVLGGPRRQRLCSGDRWGLLGRSQDLRVEAEPLQGGAVMLQARLPGRSVAIPLLTVTAADAKLHGLSTTQLAADWREVLERRVRHARRIMQPEQLELRLGITLVVQLILAASTARCLWLWSRSRRALHRHQLLARASKDLQASRASRLQTTSHVLVTLTLVQVVLMVGLGLAAVPGRLPLAVAVLLQPLTMLIKSILVAAVVWVLRQLLHVFLWQWLSNRSAPVEQRARREQRYRNLLQVGRRLINLSGLIVLVVWVVSGLPGLGATPVATWLAGGAVLGALALVFQGLLRDFVAGLVVLFEDHYAVGDYVEIDGLGGDVEDVGVLATVLRTVDQRVVVLRNSRLELLVNHTKLRSGVELILPLDPACPRLDEVVALVRQECQDFAADPVWKDQLLKDPIVRGVRRVTPLAVELSILVLTPAGRQWAVERELLGRLVRRLEREGVALASSQLSSVLP